MDGEVAYRTLIKEVNVFDSLSENQKSTFLKIPENQMLFSMFTFQISSQTDDLFGYVEPYFCCCVYIHLCIHLYVYMGFPGGSDGKEFACNVGDLGSVPGLGRSPGGGHGKPLLYSCLENPINRGA